MSRLYVVGIGPGDRETMTGAAVRALTEADLIVGFTTYISLVKAAFAGTLDFADKDYFESPMTKETDRCTYALQQPDVEVEIVPGVTAAASGAAALGAPLGHDFAVISLSDRLTPWEVIEKRLFAAASGDFCIALYNPRSHGRPDALEKAVHILREAGLSADTPVGIARDIGREEASVILSCLDGIPYEECGMTSTIFIGNSTTYLDGVQLITPRGYRK